MQVNSGWKLVSWQDGVRGHMVYSKPVNLSNERNTLAIKHTLHSYPSDVVVRTELADVEWRMKLEFSLRHDIHMINISELL